MSARTCEIPGCTDRHQARGLCHKHYERKRRTGDPLGVRARVRVRPEPPPLPTPDQVLAEMEAALRERTRMMIEFEGAGVTR